MNNNFTSYQTADAPTETARTMQVRVVDAVNRVSITDGQITESAPLANDKGNTAELNPYHGTDSIFATAQSPNGVPVTAIKPETLVTIGGVQGPVSFWVAEGILQQGADGTYSEASAVPEVAPKVDPMSMAPISDAAMATVNDALDPVPQEALDGLAAVGIGAALGRLDSSALVQKFQQASGLDLDAAHARVAAFTAVYQAQTDGVLTGRFGLAAEDLPSFYAYCRTNKQGQMQEALHMQLREHDVSRWGVLAGEWQSKTAPSMAALKASGVPVRKNGNSVEAFVRGSWMSPSAAARAGLI